MKKRQQVETLETRRLLTGDRPPFAGDFANHPNGCPCCGGGLPHMASLAGVTRSPGADYEIGARWAFTSTSGNTGSLGNPITLTWGLVADGTLLQDGGGGGIGEPNAPSTLRARLNTLYGSQSTWLPLFQSVFDRWSQVSGITYVYQPNDDGASFPSSPGANGVRPDIRIGGHPLDGAFGTLAYNYFPDSGDMVIDTDDFGPGGLYNFTANNSRWLRNVISHEHGHGLGFEHVIPVNGTKLMEPNATDAFDGPQFDDILAVQRNYGDPLERGGRNETAATANNLGTLVNGANQILRQQISIASASDLDFFRFTVGAGQQVSFTIAPEGSTYLEGPQFGSASDFNAAAQGNLSVSLIGTNGVSVLQTANANAAGLSESLSNLNLAPGTYFLRVSIVSGTTQMYRLSASVSNTAPVLSEPDLADTSDTGASNIDNITFDNTPTLSGSAPANTTVQIFDGTTLVGSGVSTAGGIYTITTSTLSDGVRNLTARTLIGATLSAPTTALAVTIDTAAPTFALTSYDREVTQRLSVTLTDAVADQIALGEFTLTNTTTSTVAPLLNVSYTGGNTVATVSPTNQLGNGRYRLTTAAGAAVDIAGNLTPALLFEFTQIAGDATGDGVVDFADLLILAQNYNATGRTFSQGNFSYDLQGAVNFGDLLILAQNYGVSVLASPAPTPATRRRSNSGGILA